MKILKSKIGIWVFSIVINIEYCPSSHKMQGWLLLVDQARGEEKPSCIFHTLAPSLGYKRQFCWTAKTMFLMCKFQKKIKTGSYLMFRKEKKPPVQQSLRSRAVVIPSNKIIYDFLGVEKRMVHLSLRFIKNAFQALFFLTASLFQFYSSSIKVNNNSKSSARRQRPQKEERQIR